MEADTDAATVACAPRATAWMDSEEDTGTLPSPPRAASTPVAAVTRRKRPRARKPVSGVNANDIRRRWPLLVPVDERQQQQPRQQPKRVPSSGARAPQRRPRVPHVDLPPVQETDADVAVMGSTRGGGGGGGSAYDDGAGDCDAAAAEAAAWATLGEHHRARAAAHAAPPMASPPPLLGRPLGGPPTASMTTAAAAAAASAVAAAAAAEADEVTQRERKKRRRRQQAAAAACGDAIPIDTERRLPRQRAEERHNSESHPAWDLQAALAACEPIAPNPHVAMTPPVINNVVATAKCVDCVPDMQRLVWLLAGRRSHGEFARPVTVSLWPEGSTIAIQTSTGILNQTGQKSAPAAVIAIWAYMEAVATHLHVPLAMASFEVYNMHATFRVGGYVDLRALHAAVEHSIYNPDLIQCVSICIKDPRATVLVWATGAVVVNGCRTREAHMRVYNEFGRFLSQFVRAGSGVPARAPARVRAAAAAAAAAPMHAAPHSGSTAGAPPFASSLPAPLRRVKLRDTLWDM